MMKGERGRNLIFVGPPGAGKGTQAEKICQKNNIPTISTGNILREALKSGSIAGAGLDVFWNEPTHIDDEILHCPNVIASPHSAAQTREAVIKMAKMCVNGCLAVVDGKKWPYVADKAVYDHPKWAGKEWAEV